MIYSLILFLPLIGALVTGLFGKSVGARNSELITSIFVSISAASIIVSMDWAFPIFPAKII